MRYAYYHLPKEFNNETLLIITPDISKNNSFTLLDSPKLIFPNTIYAISIKPEFEKYKYVFLAILNSKLIEWFIKKISPSIRGGYYRYKSTYLEKIPIIQLDDTVCNRLNKIVVEIIDMKQNQINIKNSFIAFLERELETKIVNFKRKSYIPNCFNFPFSGRKESIFNIIKDNNKLININYHSKEFQENLEEEFIKCKNQITELDETAKILEINQIIYELYGLTSEEIVIIENSFSE